MLLSACDSRERAGQRRAAPSPTRAPVPLVGSCSGRASTAPRRRELLRLPAASHRTARAECPPQTLLRWRGKNSHPGDRDQGKSFIRKENIDNSHKLTS